MIRYIVTFTWLFVFLVAAAAQSQPATPAVPVVTEEAATQTTPVAPEDDARLSVCRAPIQPGFAPYLIRPGDTLGNLLAGTDGLTVTQIAALNCIDDPAALPIGAVIYLPEAAVGTATLPEDPTPNEDAAYIASFETSAEVVPNQAGVTFTWEAVGTAAYLYPCSLDAHIECQRPALATPYPTEHTLTISYFSYAGPARYRLEVVDGIAVVSQDVEIEVVCSQVPLGPSSGLQACPADAARAIFGAWQPFEGGVMLWFSDTRDVWVMTNDDHRVQVFHDSFTDGDPDPADVAPEGLFTPHRGFGQVWEELGGPESSIGWALAEELGFDSARQPAGRNSYTTYVQGPGTTVYAVTFIPGMDDGYWAWVVE